MAEAGQGTFLTKVERQEQDGTWARKAPAPTFVSKLESQRMSARKMRQRSAR